jgi:hypothetical protein
MTTVGVSVRGAAAALISGISLLFGFAGTAHAHGTHVAPVEPMVPRGGAHHGPFSVLHQAGPFSVLRPLTP